VNTRAGSLSERVEAALEEIGGYFLGSSPLPHVVVRATEDVDILITREGLDRFEETWRGRGYVDLRPGGEAVRDTLHGVKIAFLIAGE
jgi:hypothetical protein